MVLCLPLSTTGLSGYHRERLTEVQTERRHSAPPHYGAAALLKVEIKRLHKDCWCDQIEAAVTGL